jgi:hypothetical protein
VTTEVITEGEAVWQTDEDGLVKLSRVDATEDVLFAVVTLASGVNVPETVTVEVRLTSSVTVARFAEVIVVGTMAVAFAAFA